MFDEQERTRIKEIPPAKDRIDTYKRKNNPLYSNYDNRPMSGATVFTNG